MTIVRINGLGFGVGDKLTSSQINGIDVNTTYALDRRSGQTDTLASTVSLTGRITTSGSGRIVEPVLNGANANTTYLASGANRTINVNADVTANRVYTFSATDAVNGDLITIRCASTFLYEITVNDQDSAPLFQLGNLASSDGTWATIVCIASKWELFRSSGNGGVKVHSQTFTGDGVFDVPDNVYWVDLDGWGAGGGGGGGGGGSTASTYGLSGAGGAGSQHSRRRVPVSPGDSIAVTMGIGGAGGAPETDGGNGGDTLFGSIATFPGAGGGSAGLSEVGATTTKISLGGVPVASTGSLHFGNVVFTDDTGWWTIPRVPGSGGIGSTTLFGTMPPSPGVESIVGSLGGAPGAAGIQLALVGQPGAGGGGGGGGNLLGVAGGAGGAGGNANDAAGGNGTAGADAADNSGGGGGGGGSGGSGSTGGVGGVGGDGGSGKLIVSWVR